MSIFKRRCCSVEIILLCVRWHGKYRTTVHDLAEMIPERGVAVDPFAIFRWVQRYAPDIEKRIRPCEGRLRLLESGGDPRPVGRKYLFHSVDKHCQLLAFMISDRRNANTTYPFLRKVINAM